MERFKPIPNWVYTGKLPAFYDTESGTAVEQTARLHAAVKGLIDDYNKFVNELNTSINEFINSTNQDQEEFKDSITKIIHDYIHMIDDKIALLETSVENGITKYMEQALQDGRIVIGVTYDDETESLNVTGGVE